MANLQNSANNTAAALKTILNQSAYNLTVDQLKTLRESVAASSITDPSVTIVTALGGNTVVNSASLAASGNSPTTRYSTGDVMSITVTFSDIMTVTGTPQIAVVIGSNTRQFAYASGTGTAALVFSYTVVSGDAAAAAAVTVATSALALNSGTIKDFRAVASGLTLPTVSGVATAHVNQ